MDPEFSFPCSQQLICGRFSPHSLFYFMSNPFTIILTSTSRASKLFLSFRFAHQVSLCISFLPHTCHKPFQFILESLITNNIWRGLQIMKLVIMYFSRISCYFLPLSFRHLPQHPVLNKICAYILLLTCNTKFHTLVSKISPITGLDRPRGFQEVKVPRFRDNGTELW